MPTVSISSMRGCILVYADTITLFNRCRSGTGDTWYPTVLRGVDLNVDKASILAKYGAESNGVAKLHVNYRTDSDFVYIGAKQYLSPKEWSRQAKELLPKSLTFTGGTDFDFFYVGEWPEETISDEAYDNIDGFYGYMNSHYDRVFAISSVARYSVIPHFEIMAR